MIHNTNSENRRPTVIQKVDFPIGSGKTTAAILHALRLARAGHKVLICQPTKTIIDETHQRIVDQMRGQNWRIPVESIYSTDENSGSVKRIHKHITKARSGVGEIILITHAAWMRLPDTSRKIEWDLFMDEVPQVDWCQQFSLAEHVNEIQSLIDVVPHNAEHVRLEEADSGRDRIDEISDNEREDQWWRDLGEFTRRLTSPHWILKCRAERWEKFQNGEANSFFVSGWLRASVVSGWRSVTLMSACLSETLPYLYWQQDGVEFVPHPDIKPLNDRHTNGDLIKFYYCHTADNSKRLRKRSIDLGNGQSATVESLNLQRITALFGNEPFVYLANKDADCSSLPPSSEQLPNSPHGINSYRHLHNVAVLSALNPPPEHIANLIDDLQIEPDQIRTAGYRQSVYQAIGRISIRVPDDQNRKRVVLPDRATAEWIAEMFPGSEILPLPEISHLKPMDELIGQPQQVGRPRLHKDKAARDSLYRKNKIDDLIEEMRVIESDATKLPYTGTKGDFVASGNLFLSIYSDTPYHSTAGWNADQLFDFLRDRSAMEFSDKFDNSPFSPAFFDKAIAPDRSPRGRQNIAYMRHVCLDNDGGGISPDEFAALFPHVRMFIYSTRSSHNDNKRYRVIIPTVQFFGVRTYAHLIAEICTVLRRRGWYGAAYFEKHADNPEHLIGKRNHGFDEGKFKPESIFLLPCKSLHGAEHTFLIDHHPECQPLDVMSWIVKPTQRMKPAPEVTAEAPEIEDEFSDYSADQAMAILNILNSNSELSPEVRQKLLATGMPDSEIDLIEPGAFLKRPLVNRQCPATMITSSA